MNPNGDKPDWQQGMREQYGENPAHFLDRPLQYDDSLPPMIRDRIDGIDRVEVVEAWRAAEKQLRRGLDMDGLPDGVSEDVAIREFEREPGRQPVLDALDDRRQYLEAHGERPEDLRANFPHELPDRYQPVDRTVPEKQCYLIDDDGERVRYAERPTGLSVGRPFDYAQEEGRSKRGETA